MISLIKSLSANNNHGEAAPAPDTTASVQLPPHIKASERQQAYDLQVLSDTGNGLAGHQLRTAATGDPKTLILIDTDAAIAQCFATLRELRPHLQREGFVERIKLQQQEGYR